MTRANAAAARVPEWRQWIVPSRIEMDPSGWDREAARLGVQRAALEAVPETDSGNPAWLADGRPKIQFEAHIFHNQTAGKYDRSHSHLSSETRNRALTAGPAGEYARFEQALALDWEAALTAVRWGRFLLLGGHYHEAGFTSLEEMAAAMFRGDEPQFAAYVRVLDGFGLAPHMAARWWEEFAAVYFYPGRPPYPAALVKAELRAAYRIKSG